MTQYQFATTLPASATQVLSCGALGRASLEALFARYVDLQIVWLSNDTAIPGSFWGESEAGLIGSTLYLRDDTPVHSALHEGCHWLCMPPARRPTLHTNVGGKQIEENATCYLQIVLADYLPTMGRARMWRDMDDWGYSFRLGSAQQWFEQDADDAREWLLQQQMLDAQLQPTWHYRR